MAARDPTFQKFSAEEAKAYAASRGISYPPKVFEEILQYHNGPTNLAVDVGCGPGNVTRDLVRYFSRVIGLDNSPGMIEAANSFITADPDGKLSFKVSRAESIDAEEVGIAAGSVDMITCAVAIHWFDLPEFYAAAAKTLKSGGSVAAWIGAPAQASSICPYAAQIDAAFDDLGTALKPYKMSANILADDSYVNLPLPWTIEPQNQDFDESSFKRIVFSQENGNALMRSYPLALTRLEQSIYSASPYVRWREANPDIANTENDLPRLLVQKIKQIVGEEPETIDMEVKMVLLLFKKK